MTGRHLRAMRALLLLVSLLIALPQAASAAPEVDVHDLTWFVHVDLIDPGMGEDLAYWQGVVDDAVNRGSQLIEGRSGPADQVCCARLTNSVALQTFGTTGDGLDVIDSLADQNTLATIGLPGSRAFLVDSLTWCNGSSPGAIGCAINPGCSGNPNDDPDLWMYVTLDAFDDGTLASVVAHERGHNTCLPHIAAAKCQLMQATIYTPGLGGCLAPTECTNFRNGRTEFSSGLSCECHDDFQAPLADGTSCGAGSVCSGGRCGLANGDAAVSLMAAADAGDAGLAPEDALRVSALTGDWTNLGQITGAADDIRALAYAHDSATLYGVVPRVFDDSIVAINTATGGAYATVGTIANGTREILSMAYDPGPTGEATDDRLLVLETDGSVGELFAIDPASASSPTLLGNLFAPGFILDFTLFTGMAYDSIRDQLYFATPYGPNGLWVTDPSTCSGGSCTITQLTEFGLFMDNASLAFSRDSGMLYLTGTSFGFPNTRTFYNVIDPTTEQSVETLSLDRFTPAGLAALPEPGIVTGITAGLLALALTARRRRPLR